MTASLLSRPRFQIASRPLAPMFAGSLYTGPSWRFSWSTEQGLPAATLVGRAWCLRLTLFWPNFVANRYLCACSQRSQIWAQGLYFPAASRGLSGTCFAILQASCSCRAELKNPISPTTSDPALPIIRNIPYIPIV